MSDVTAHAPYSISAFVTSLVYKHSDRFAVQKANEEAQKWQIVQKIRRLDCKNYLVENEIFVKYLRIPPRILIA